MRFPIDLEGRPKQLEEVLPRPEEIGGQRVERGRKELHGVFEHRVLSAAERRVLFHSLANEVDVEQMEAAKTPHDQVRIVAPQIVEEDGNLVRLPRNQSPPLVCCTQLLARHGGHSRPSYRC